MAIDPLTNGLITINPYIQIIFISINKKNRTVPMCYLIYNHTTEPSPCVIHFAQWNRPLVPHGD